jgi:formylglycine-generating enzyme required for sulfatase activity
MSFYIQEEGVTLPIEASPYETGQLGARTNLQDSLKSAERMLLLGDPGSGKTVALERLAWELSGGNEPVIPLVIKLFKYDGKPLADWVRARLQECGCLRLDDEDTLTVFLQEGAARCVFLFDGLNEVAPEHRNLLVGELDRWMSACPRHAVIVTSRVQDELWRKLRGEIPAMVVQPIHNEQARGYLTAHLGDAQGDELYRRLDERLLALTRTPLVLWLIKEAGAAGESLPGNRGELYQRFVARMLQRDKDRQMNGLFSERTKERALSMLALHISHAQRLTCPRREAVDVVAGAFEKDIPEKMDKAEALVDACARHGLLAGEDELWFAPHQTVQEHFAAVALQESVRQEQSMSVVARLGRDIQEVLTRKKIGLNALAAEDWWMETLVQLAGIIADPNWLARAIAQTNPWLAWWCVQEGRQVDEATRLWIEERSSKLLRSPQVADRRRAVQTLVQTHNERVLRPLLEAAADEDKEVSLLALQGLAGMGEAARTLIEDVLHGKDELLWVSALRYLRVLPDASLWAEIPEQMWDKFMTVEDQRVAIKAMSHEKSKKAILFLLRISADDNKEISHLAAQRLENLEGVVWKKILEPIQAESKLFDNIRQCLEKQIKLPTIKEDRQLLLSKLIAINTLARIESKNFTSQYWKPPYGEPEWITIPAGEFWMGSEKGDNIEKPLHKLFLPEYQIARVPITNAQYAIYVKDAGAKVPKHWVGGSVPPGLENHPVVNVSWMDAMKYCNWLDTKIKDTKKIVRLPSEAQWEKSARGDKDQREYPWGDGWREPHCNSHELGLNNTTPVGLFLNGASPYGLLDMSGNIWEWTRSQYEKYPYKLDDRREDLQGGGPRVLRGGSFNENCGFVYCWFRNAGMPSLRNNLDGFRVVIYPLHT